MKPRPGTRLAELALLRKRGDVARLIAELDNDNVDDGVLLKAWAAYQLGKLGDQHAALPLTRLLTDKQEDARIAGVRALGRIKDPSTVEALIESLADSSRNVRNWAAESLGFIGDPAAIAHLLAMLREAPAPSERAYASRALGRIGDPRAFDGLLAALNDEHRTVRWLSAEALSKIGDDRAVPALRAALRRRRLVDGRPLRRAIRALSSQEGSRHERK